MTDDGLVGHDDGVDEAVASFWTVARVHARLGSTVPSYFGPSTLEVVPPPTWALGDTPEAADEAAAAVLDDSLSATVTPRAAYDEAGEPLPEPGALGILVDGAGRPVALLATSSVEVLPLGEVVLDGLRGSDLPDGDDADEVVLERFTVLHRA
ncbi:MAG: ASCH domain-containing protein [Nocardioides sp.]|nr:ASCH domain-containing protein [Nocardioides sp.]